MRTKSFILLGIFLSISALLFAAIKKGDLVETQGAKSGIWFPGKVENIKDGKFNVISFGWEAAGAKEIDKKAIRPITKNTQISVRKGGSVYAVIDADGTIRVNGSIVGSIADDGTVRKNGSIVGEISLNGEVWKNGQMKGSVWPTSEIYNNSGVIGSMDNVDGTIRKGGSIWGSVEPFNKKFRDMRAAFAILTFFTNDFGY